MNTVNLPLDIASPAPHFTSTTSWALYVYLLAVSDEHGIARIGRKSTANTLLISQNAVRRALDNLCANGWIRLGDPNVAGRRPPQEATPHTSITVVGYTDYIKNISSRDTHQGHPNVPQKTKLPDVQSKQMGLHIYTDIPSQIPKSNSDRSLIPKGSERKPENKTAQTPPLADKRVTWLTPFWDAWKERIGGEPSGGQLAKYLKPLIESHGQDRVIAGWKKYLEKTEPQFASPARFSQTFGHWVKGAPKENPNAVWVSEKDLPKLKEILENHRSRNA